MLACSYVRGSRLQRVVSLSLASFLSPRLFFYLNKIFFTLLHTRVCVCSFCVLLCLAAAMTDQMQSMCMCRLLCCLLSSFFLLLDYYSYTRAQVKRTTNGSFFFFFSSSLHTNSADSFTITNIYILPSDLCQTKFFFFSSSSYFNLS